MKIKNVHRKKPGSLDLKNLVGPYGRKIYTYYKDLFNHEYMGPPNVSKKQIEVFAHNAACVVVWSLAGEE